MTDFPQYPGCPTYIDDVKLFLYQIARTVNNILSGKINVCLDITIEPGTEHTVIKDPRITYFSYIGIMAKDSHGAVNSESFWFTDQSNGAVELRHNIYQFPYELRVVIIG